LVNAPSEVDSPFSGCAFAVVVAVVVEVCGEELPECVGVEATALMKLGRSSE
jgi:hypothetical protein